MQPGTATDGKPRQTRSTPLVLVVLGALGTALLWEPLTGVFRRTVEFNAVGTSAFALWGVVIAAALVLSVRHRRDPGSLPRFQLALAFLLACLALVTWVTILATGAIGNRAVTSPNIQLEREGP